MSIRLVVILFAASLLDWCQVSVTAKVGRRGRIKYRTVVGVYDFQHCRDRQQDLIVRNTTNRIGQDGTEYLDIDFELMATTHTVQKMSLVLQRCPLGVGGQCEYFDTWAFKSPCGLIGARGMIWTPMVDSTEPRFICPFTKGSYTARNLTVDIGALAGPVLDGVGAEKYSWPSEVQYYNGDRLFMCYSFVAFLKRVRVRDP